MLDLYILPAMGHIRLGRLSPDTIQGEYARLQTKGHHRAALKVHTVLHRACRFAVLWRWIEENPCDRVLRPTYRPGRREIWQPEQLAEFLTGAEDHWLHPLWVLLIATGCRLGEVSALEWADVDLAGASVHIAKSIARIRGAWVVAEPKTKAGVRSVSLPEIGLQALERQAAQQADWRLKAGPDWQDSGLVFTAMTGAPLHGPVIAHCLRKECRRLSLPCVTPHGLRHLHASLLLSEGLPVTAVSARLGHANPGITMSVYAHALRKQDHEAAQAIGRALKGER